VIGLDRYRAAIRHRLNSVSKQIHKKLNDLTGVTLNFREIIRTVQFDLDILLVRGRGMDRDNIVKQRRYGDVTELSTLTRSHQTQAIGQSDNP